MFSQVGVPELLIILFVVLLLFGGKRLPGLGRQLGDGLREFKDSIRGRPTTTRTSSQPPASERPALPAPRPVADVDAEPVAEATSERRG